MGNFQRRFEQTWRRQDCGVSFCLSTFDRETSGAVGVTGFGGVAGFAASAFFQAQRSFQEAVRRHWRPKDKQQQRDDLMEARHA